MRVGLFEEEEPTSPAERAPFLHWDSPQPKSLLDRESQHHPELAAVLLCGSRAAIQGGHSVEAGFPYISS